jgi:hypothetical protein
LKLRGAKYALFKDLAASEGPKRASSGQKEDNSLKLSLSSSIDATHSFFPTERREKNKRMKPFFYGPGKEVCVVGASRGIGAELVSQLLARGCDRVYATERVVGKSAALASLARDAENKDRLTLLRVDTSDSVSIAAFAESLAEERKGARRKALDLVITNAGIAEW